MTSAPVILEQNYFDQEVENLICRIKEDGRVLPDRYTVEETLLDHLPRSWNELLGSTKAVLFQNSTGYLRGSYFWSSRDNVSVERLRKSIKIQQRLIEALERYAKIAGIPSPLPLVEAISAWAERDVRTHKEQVFLNGIAHELWVQELSFVATNGVTSTGTPIGIWRFRIGALFPKPRSETKLRDLIPEIRIELLEFAMLEGSRVPDHLCHIIKRLVESACVNVAWALSSAADEIELYRDSGALWPMSVALSLPEGYNETAKKVFELCTAESDLGLIDFRDALADQDADLVRIVCRSGSVIDQPMVKPKSPNRTAKPKPECPGDVFLLMEFSLAAVALCKDGMVDRRVRIDRSVEFRSEYGQDPDTVISNMGIDREALRQLTKYDQVMAILENAPGRWGLDTDELKTAIWLSGVGRPTKQQPIIRLLVDLATGMMAVSITKRHESTTSFLERETSAGSRLGALPKHLKVAKTLHLPIQTLRHGRSGVASAWLHLQVALMPGPNMFAYGTKSRRGSSRPRVVRDGGRPPSSNTMSGNRNAWQ